ncbi:MAG: hypothetical protein IPK54_01595 [Dokdonella sp.]|uniref:hypothetical protein n=1 Tax=Dokdonella sp. TaxID=2291710 RepID=UPI0025B8DC23|nr:hypothetical protein [Dokdonella sp.]MBK8122274.1 hypothetical protein [Dokdonella sp.]
MDALGNPLMLAELDAGQVDALGRHVHQQERRCGGFFSFPSRAAAEAFLANDRSRQAAQFEPTGGYTIDNANVVNAWLPQVSELNIYNTISHLQAYQNRYYAKCNRCGSCRLDPRYLVGSGQWPQRCQRRIVHRLRRLWRSAFGDPDHPGHDASQ